MAKQSVFLIGTDPDSDSVVRRFSLDLDDINFTTTLGIDGGPTVIPVGDGGGALLVGKDQVGQPSNIIALGMTGVAINGSAVLVGYSADDTDQPFRGARMTDVERLFNEVELASSSTTTQGAK